MVRVLLSAHFSFYFILILTVPTNSLLHASLLYYIRDTYISFSCHSYTRYLRSWGLYVPFVFVTCYLC
ncbi:hypothetical protein F4775DRAFT_535315 [Biscogniauxia sp. FL1348]|nr:hypothetical protein F4775DRAFT_535315 [Biscogniauxia sp. FL1348]